MRGWCVWGGGGVHESYFISSGPESQGIGFRVDNSVLLSPDLRPLSSGWVLLKDLDFVYLREGVTTLTFTETLKRSRRGKCIWCVWFIVGEVNV